MSSLDLNACLQASGINNLLESPWGPICFQSHSIEAECLNSLILEESGPRLPTESSWFQIQEPEISCQRARKGVIKWPSEHCLVICVYLLFLIAFILHFQRSRASSLVSTRCPGTATSHKTFFLNIEFIGPITQPHLKHLY